MGIIYEVMVEWRQCPSPGDISILHVELSCVTYHVVELSDWIICAMAQLRMSYCYTSGVRGGGGGDEDGV